MFLPLNDGVAMRRLPASTVTFGLIGLNCLIFLMTWGFGEQFADHAALGYGAIPSVVTGRDWIDEQLWSAPPYATLVTSQFLHADWLHLLGNMLFLFTFGDNVEDAMGHIRFLIFYILSGIAGALTYVLFDSGSQSPLIGASGAISGVVAAYLMLYPKVHIFGLALNVIPVRIKALYVLGAWLAMQVGYSFIQSDGNVAYTAHMGGAVAGALLVGLFKAREVPLFGQRTN